MSFPLPRPPGTEQNRPILSITNLLMEFFNTGFILYFFLLVLSDAALELDIGEVGWVGPPRPSPGWLQAPGRAQGSVVPPPRPMSSTLVLKCCF